MVTVAAAEICILDLVQPFDLDKDGDSLFPAETLRDRYAFRRTSSAKTTNTASLLCKRPKPPVRAKENA